MSRVRFHSIKGFSNITYVKYWGLNWKIIIIIYLFKKNINTLDVKFDIVI